LVYKRETIVEKQLSVIDFGSKIKIGKEQKRLLEGNTLLNNTVLGGYLKTNLASKDLQNALDWFKHKLSGLIFSHTKLFHSISDELENNHIDKNHVISFLKKADFKINDIIIKKEENLDTIHIINFDIKEEKKKEQVITDYNTKYYRLQTLFLHTLDNNNTFPIPYHEESQGTQRYYQLSGLLASIMKTPSILLIDELESSLHPDLLKHFLLSFLANTKNAQLIATTHLRELLMEKDIFRNDAIWFTEKQADGSTDLFSLADFDSSVVRDTSSIYNAYKIGKLGATPNLSDYYIDVEDGEK